MNTDPVADLLTRIRNALMIERAYVDVPYSRLKQGICAALQREGYIWDFEVVQGEPWKALRIGLKYGPNGERVIRKIDRVSKPGRRVYSGVRDLPNVLQGMGVCILSTNAGVVSSREAKAKQIGGEVLCSVW